MVKFSDSKLKIEQNKYREFGKFIMNMALLDQNILLVKYKSYAPVPALKRTNISDELKDLLYYLFDTGEIDYKAGQKLSQSEKSILDKLLMKSGLHLQLKYKTDKLDEDIDAIIEEFEILKGEIIAGNDNPKIKEDIKEILVKLVRLKKISKDVAEDILQDL
jgi:hypothetical protein